MSILSFMLLYVVGIPISTLLHEIGHALGVIVCSKERAHVYLGAKNFPENLRIGRIHFHIRWGFFGFCTPQKGSSLTRKQSLGFIAGGPIMTLAVLLCASYLARYFTDYAGIHYFLMAFFIGILFNFLQQHTR
ncbi:hypothetical protein [Lysinibacillus sp. G01H]|uniref:hypothetical protein n=1 Tax=Lysinibacillus sp. G01H TaxID=3026425 RepID=UPI00237E7B18|nr:hypothetical protein [Lysinibacillus sp. G01H]WDU81582.1 hypothetical protein PSR12_10560 [Lysinibacillus sp. G01H]